MFLGENEFFTKSENKFRKKFKCLLKGCCMAKKEASKILEQYINKLHTHGRLIFLTTVNTYRWCVSFGVEYISKMIFYRKKLFFFDKQKPEVHIFRD